MTPQKDLRKLAVLGSTGSIGRATLDVVRHAGGRMQVVALSAHTNTALLAEQVREFRPKIIVVTSQQVSDLGLLDLKPEARSPKPHILYGPDALCEVVTQDDIDVIVSAIVGSAGLKSTLCALEAGKTVALANKESLVVGGELVTDTAWKSGGKILHIDSEHSAIWQCLVPVEMTKEPQGNFHSSIQSELWQCLVPGNPKPEVRNPKPEVQKIILTASGGPFRHLSLRELERVTVADALAHPTWNMGRKITIDSATLMNKALEIIEARWLFDMPPEKIRVVLHPQSVVHSMVEFVDGAVMAQLSPPDMRLPIQWAIDYPNRFPCPARRIDWNTMMSLEFFPPDFERFPALQLGLEVAAQGGTAGAVLNAANEVAVDAFLQEKLPFHQITTVCQSILHHHHHEHRPTFTQLMAADRWARLETQKWISR